MTKHIKVGKKGESLALSYFKEKGYHILHQSWRSGNWEVDLIASKNDILHII
jgi:putative endonuclease